MAASIAILGGCAGSSVPSEAAGVLPESRPVLLSRFSCEDEPCEMPEAVSGLSGTAWGRFHGQHQGDVLMDVALAADSAGLLLILVLPENADFTGSRDHLVVKLDESGVPVEVFPDTGIDLFEDSLWKNPLARQTAILELAGFLRPDAVIQFFERSADAPAIVEFWSENASPAGMTALFLDYSYADGINRGWGVFTGFGVTAGILEGMTAGNFTATALLLCGIPWHETGYPVMQAFSTMENR